MKCQTSPPSNYNFFRNSSVLKWKLSLTLILFHFIFKVFEKKRLVKASRIIFQKKTNQTTSYCEHTFFSKWQKLKTRERAVERNSCEPTWLSTEGETSWATIECLLQAQEGRLMHIMDLANNRGLNLLLNFLLIVLVLVLAFILVKLMWTSVRLYGGFCNDNVDSPDKTAEAEITNRECVPTPNVSESNPKSCSRLFTCHWVKKAPIALLSNWRNSRMHRQQL